ncbi:hypothetical protein EMCRGX_G002353 [Ephydatia muelleri]
MAATNSLLLVLSCLIGVTKCSRVAVIVLQQSSSCCSTSITEGNNVTACASLVHTYGDIPLSTDIHVLFNTSSGTALSPQDFNAISEVRVFMVGSVEGLSVCVNISTIDDDVVEYTETFQITLSTNSSNVTIGDRSGGITFTVNMYDNDVATVAFAQNFTFLYQWENTTSVHLCAQLVAKKLERPVTASLYPYSGTATGMWLWGDEEQTPDSQASLGLVSDLGSLVQAMGAMRVVVAAARVAAGEVVVGALVLLLLLLAVGAALLLVAVRAALLLVAVGAALLLVAVGAALLLLLLLVAVRAALLLLLLLVAVRAALLLLLVEVGAALLLVAVGAALLLLLVVAVRAALLLLAVGAALLLLAANGRGAALHLTESIETKCKDLVFTFFVLSKQSALFGR